MTAATAANAPDAAQAAVAARRAKVKLLLTAGVAAWGRAVIVIVGVALLAHVVGLGEASGFAVIPGMYMALGPPVGRMLARVLTVGLATVLVLAMIIAGTLVADSAMAVTIGLVIVGFAVGMVPRLGPRWAAMQLPVLMSFTYAAAFPTEDMGLGTRLAVVAVSLPIYVLAAAVLFQSDARRALRLGAAAALGDLAKALGRALGGAADAAHDAELGLLKFRTATGTMRDAAIPYDDSLDSRAGRMLTTAVQQAVVAGELLAAHAATADAEHRTRIATLAQATGGMAKALADPDLATPPAGPLEEAAAAARHGGDAPASLLADALAGAANALPVLRGTAHHLPAGWTIKLPGPGARLRGALTPRDPLFRRAVRLAIAVGAAGMIAALLDLSRTYWAVFAAVVVLNAPAALSRKRALMRIGGTLVGFLLALVLLELVGDNAALATALALVSLLFAMLLMPLNYAAAVLFITCTVSMMFTSTGEEADFLRYRLADNIIGVAVVCGVGLVLWRGGRADWWRAAQRMAATLADTVAAPDPSRRRDEIVTRVLQLRTETVESAALAGTSPAFGAAWIYVAAAEDLTRALVGPRDHGDAVQDGPRLAAALSELAQRCVEDPATRSAPLARDLPTTRAALDVDRMAAAVDALQRL